MEIKKSSKKNLIISSVPAKCSESSNSVHESFQFLRNFSQSGYTDLASSRILTSDSRAFSRKAHCIVKRTVLCRVQQSYRVFFHLQRFFPLLAMAFGNKRRQANESPAARDARREHEQRPRPLQAPCRTLPVRFAHLVFHLQTTQQIAFHPRTATALLRQRFVPRHDHECHVVSRRLVFRYLSNYNMSAF